MAIIQPENMDFSDKTFSMIIYGSPGVGKTTLAMSAPDPILLDFDRGVSRVRAEHRRATSICQNYKEVLADLSSPEMRTFKTIVIDTGGSLVSMLKDWAFTEKGATLKNGEFDSRKGFGVTKAEWASLTDHIKTVLRKNVIYIFHSNEEKDKDGNPIQRLVCEGSVRNTVWTPCDFGGYIQMIDNKRVICFTPEQEFFAKGCHGIHGRIQIPTLDEGVPNDFITRLFEKAKANIAAEAAIYAPQKAQYEEVMETVRSILAGVTDLESANEALRVIPDLEHALTSKKESGAMLQAKAKELGLKYDKIIKAYYKPEEAPAPGV